MERLHGESFSGPRFLEYSKPAPMTEKELEEHNAEMIRFRRIIGPARKPRTSKEQLRVAERALCERETNPAMLQKIDQQKRILREKGFL
jgi:hypothetical protein